MGRPPTILTDESIRYCRYFVANTFSQMDDVGLVSSVEFIATRAKVRYAMNLLNCPVRLEEIAELEAAHAQCQDCYQFWDDLLSTRYEEYCESRSSFDASMSFDLPKFSLLPRKSANTIHPEPTVSKCNLLARHHPKKRSTNAVRAKTASNAINRSGKSSLVNYFQFGIL